MVRESSANESGIRHRKENFAGWSGTPIAHLLLGRKHTLRILLFLYVAGAASTTSVINNVRGHPASVIQALRMLERHGAIQRTRLREGHRILQVRLTLRGMQ